MTATSAAASPSSTVVSVNGHSSCRLSRASASPTRLLCASQYAIIPTGKPTPMAATTAKPPTASGAVRPSG